MWLSSIKDARTKSTKAQETFKKFHYILFEQMLMQTLLSFWREQKPKMKKVA